LISANDRTTIASSKGFTLVEIMVVVAIIAAVVAILLPRIDNRNNKLKAAVRRFTTLCREVHIRAKLKGSIYRIAFDLKSGAESTDAQRFWVEKSNQAVILSEKQEQEYRAAIKDRRAQDEKPKDPYGFEPDTSVLKTPQVIESPLRILLVEKRGYKEPFTTGMAYIYFFPQGMSEMALVQLKASDKLQWTLAVEPLTGRADLVTQLLTLKDLMPQ
jgi:general secretion pathway protein H